MTHLGKNEYDCHAAYCNSVFESADPAHAASVNHGAELVQVFLKIDADFSSTITA